MKANWTRWREDHGEDMLWVCQVCDAHVHADSVGDTCPACGAPTEDEEQEKEPAQ